jgi:nitrite reductase/ring-hydroxylating ferredoxin subunit
MAGRERLICSSAALVDGGPGVRFEAEFRGERVPAFAVRYAGRVHAYLNRCAHLQMELDWRAGEFFDAESRHLICSTHGATYDAASGECLGGPCAGAPLVRVAAEERDGNVYCMGLENG